MRSIISFLTAFASVQCFAQIQPSHIVILILENHSYSQIAGNPQAPYINSVLNDTHTARLTQSYGLTHPSQPNYLMLYSGSSQGVTSNNLPSPLPFTAPNLGASLLQSGFSFIGYSEDLPSVGFTGETSGAYARKHNPWVNWQNAATNGIPTGSNRPFSDFPIDINSLPAVSIVVPNLNHDIHDGTISVCDAWVQTNLGAYIQWCKSNNGLFILTFDEDDASANNQILTFFTGVNIKPGLYDQRVTHYNILRTIEELYQLPYAGASADSSAVKNIWITPLSIEAFEFNVQARLTTAVLKWQTLNEHDTKEFYIERSTNRGQSWERIAIINAAGNSTSLLTYNFIDTHPAIGINLYRIKQVDLNNHFVFSRMLAIQIGEVKVHYKVYPNPAKDILSIISAKNENSETEITIVNVAGEIVFKKNYLLVTGIPAQIDLSHLGAGVYFVQIVGRNETTTEKIIVE